MYRLHIIFIFLLVLSMNIFSQKRLENITIEGLQNERERTVLSMLPVAVGQNIENSDISKSIKPLNFAPSNIILLEFKSLWMSWRGSFLYSGWKSFT